MVETVSDAAGGLGQWILVQLDKRQESLGFWSTLLVLGLNIIEIHIRDKRCFQHRPERKLRVLLIISETIVTNN